ncbi:MAG: hypothetical protein U5L96_05375 [Owenweeksia sp.]|nr:hypothetical protein [Owenweeksia sp.]
MKRNLEARKKSALNLDWQDMGPDDQEGRTRSLVIDKDNPKIMYTGAVSGGLFRSTNGGASSNPVSNVTSNMIVSCIAQGSDGNIYYGTGEGLYGFYSGNGHTSSGQFLGGGIYKSTDGGNTFNVLQSTVPTPNTLGAEFSQVGKIEVDPNDPQRIYAATSEGLRLSEDEGKTWANPVNQPGANSNATDMVVTPSGEVWVTIGNSIYKSENGDSPYTNLLQNPGISSSGGRMRMAVSPQDEDYAYVVTININNQSLANAYQTTDGGATWRTIGQNSSFLNPHGNQGYYNNAVTVDPDNKERIIVGGVTLWEWSEQNGWLQLAANFVSENSPLYVHSDVHDVVFSKTVKDRFYVMSDGGLFQNRQ